MKLQTILLEQHLENSRSILRESCDGLTTYQRTIVEGIYKDSLPLIEATLTAQQIQNIFGEVEKSATAAGGNRTALGKGVDVAKKADETINKIGKWLQNTTPVQGFDNKFESLKAKASEKFPGIAKQLSALGDLAKANPGTTAAIIGVLTTIASFAGGPVGGAIAGQVLRGAVELLKGEKLSTAVGKGLKTAAYGWLAGKAFEVIGDAISGAVKSVTSQFSPKLYQLDLTHIAEKTGMPFSYESVSAFGKPEDIRNLENIFSKAREAYNAGNYAAAEAGFQQAAQLNDYMNSMDYFLDAGISNIMDQQQSIAQMQQGVSELMKGLASAAQGAAAGATAYDKSGKPVDDQGNPVSGDAASKDQKQPAKESWEHNYYVQTRPLTEGQVGYMFKEIQRIDEGPMDFIKKAAGSAVGYAAKKAGNLTTKVTADKLMSAWKKAGSPTDSNEVAELLKGQGVVDDIVVQVYQSMKLPQPGAAAQESPAAMTYKQVADIVTKLTTKDKIRLAKWVEKNQSAPAA